MAVTHSTAARNAATDAVTALIGANGRLVFRISPSTVAAPGTAVATLNLSATAFPAAVTGKVQDLRSMMTLFQQYIDAAEKSYGLNGKDMDERAISLNAMVSLHVMPPQRDEPRNVTLEVAMQEVQADSAIPSEENSAIAEG